VLNSDVTCRFPLSDLLAFHRSHGGEGTIMATRVEDPSKYGVILHDASGKISSFVEKPKEFVGNFINAGIYVFSPAVLERIPRDPATGDVIPTSIEKQVFPAMAAEGRLFVMELVGHWADVGQPKDFLAGAGLFLKWRADVADPLLGRGEGFVGNVLVDPTATIGAGCLLGPDVVIGPGCVVGDGVRIARSTLLDNVKVDAHALINGSIIGWDSTIGSWARVDNVSVLGEDVKVGAEVFLNGVVVLPHKGVNTNEPVARIIM
jgi:mannose-1-phosphate guanylyltransferase